MGNKSVRADENGVRKFGMGVYTCVSWALMAERRGAVAIKAEAE